MNKNLYKVRDKLLQKYWTGDYRSVTFADKGLSWTSKASAQEAISYLISYQGRWSGHVPANATDNWEIVEVELREYETGTEKISDFIHYAKIRGEVGKVSQRALEFVEAMYAKGVLDQIEFIFVLTPSAGARRVNIERTMEARAHMRQLGVKTRTFKERQGTFGMMDRQQALRARMVLDTEAVIDLGEVRKRVSQ